MIMVRQRFSRGLLAFALAAPSLACDAGPAAAQEQRWRGSITLTRTFTGTERGDQVTWTREERWENFVANAETADESYA
ncbi:MAG: hypothetical protein ACREKM_07030, partial [Longimicrobiales bacterium]